MIVFTRILFVLLTFLTVGCIGYSDVPSNDAVATIEGKAGCKFPSDVQVKTARMDYRSSVSFIGRLELSDEQLGVFLDSFKPRIDLHSNGHPWGATPEPVSKGIEWWDAHSIENPLSGRFDSRELEFVISITKGERLSRVHFKASWD